MAGSKKYQPARSSPATGVRTHTTPRVEKRPASFGPPKLMEAASMSTPMVAAHTPMGDRSNPKKYDA